MKIRHNSYTKPLFYGCGSLLLVLLQQQAFAAPGTLAEEPLQTSASSQPNIMFILDDSGSMETIVAEAPYDPSVTYDADPDDAAVTACASPLAAGTEVRLHLTGGSYDTPQFTIGSGSTDYDLGNDTGERCFDPTADYDANLITNAVGVRTGVAGARPYKGNYLNWYFDPDSTSGTWVQKKPGTNSRLEIAQSALSLVINDLANVRTGLALFDGSAGADFKVDLDDIGTNRGTISTSGSMLGEIASATSGGSTPLAETLHSVGRYFAQGYCSGANQLTLHPGGVSGTEEDLACTTVLHNKRTSQSNTAPIINWCQTNFTILMTDGDSKSDQGINESSHLVEDWDYDGDCSGTNSANCITGSPNYDKKIAPAAYFSTGSDYLDDVAQALYEIDLRPDLDDSEGNEVTNNLITYTIGFSAESVENNTLLEDAAIQGGGSFLQANNSADLLSAFNNATKSIISRTSSSSAVTFNSSNLSSNSSLYKALFNTARWSGEIRSFPLDGLSGDIIEDCVVGTDTNCWSATASIDNQNHTARQIMTFATGNKGIEFVTPSDYTSLSSATLPSALIDDLCQGVDLPFPCNGSETATEKAANQVYMGKLIDYLRGDRSQESQATTPIFRTRSNVLGDIVNASPIFVSKPVLARQRPGTSPFPTGTDAYSTWADTTSIKNRTAVVYAASNDGMLHALNGANGSEMMAYIPTGTFSTSATHGLHYLADPAYEHRFYVDLTPVISDVWMKHRDANGAMTSDPAWRTVLLGGQRGGGRSLFLLDITDPNKFADVGTNADELVLWEFTHDQLGNAYSKPTITMMNNGKFAAVFGNGYNSGIGGSGDCKAKLFIVYLEAGVDGSWAGAGDYQMIDTKAGGGGADCNGLSTPTLVDLDGNGTTDRAYAGDLRGNMWAFDLCNRSNGNPKVCQATGWVVGYGNASVPEPMMIAKDLSGVVQPITVKPAVSLDPKSANATDVIVAFGTGQYLTTADTTNTQLQSIYAVREQNALTNGNGNNKSMDPRTTFVLQKFDNENCIDGGVDDQGGCGRDPADLNLEGRVVEPPTAAANNRGWMIDLYDDKTAAGSGERIVVNPKIRNNILFINSLIPNVAACNAGGDGWLMALKLLDGNEPDDPVFDVHSDGIFDAKDRISTDAVAGIRRKFPGESTFLGGNMYTPCGDGEVCKEKVNVGYTQREGRMSWKEIYESQ